MVLSQISWMIKSLRPLQVIKKLKYFKLTTKIGQGLTLKCFKGTLLGQASTVKDAAIVPSKKLLVQPTSPPSIHLTHGHVSKKAIGRHTSNFCNDVRKPTGVNPTKTSHFTQSSDSQPSTTITAFNITNLSS